MTNTTFTLIAESGSSKTDWVLYKDGALYNQTTTIGFNPLIINADFVQQTLAKHDFFAKYGSLVQQVFFYGAGCSTEQRNAVIHKGIAVFFPNATIQVDHDITAAVRATSCQKPCFVAILGTGSNCVFFDGQRINYGAPAGGHLVADEGSGNHIGKLFIRDWLINRVPPSIEKAFIQQESLTKTQLIDRIYAAERPNMLLGSYAKVLSAFQETPYVQQLISESFNAFVLFQLNFFDHIENHPIHFIGSVAFHYQSILKTCLEKNGLQVGTIISSPLQGVIDYHLSAQDV